MIQIRDLTKTYVMGDNSVHALQGVSLDIEDGDFVAIMGPSGSGKSTLTHILGLLDVPSTGSYLLNGREVAGLSEDELAVFRREEIGFIFQQFNLLPRMDARENVALPLLYSRGTTSETPEEAADPTGPSGLLRRVGLGPRAAHRPNELSGGQQQRVAIARSLVNHPRMVLADEPTGNLDSKSEKEILAALKELNDQGITVIVVTHEEDVGALAHRLIRMRDGVIQSDERRVPLAKDRPHLAPVESSKRAVRSRLSLAEIGIHFREGAKTLMANKLRTALSMLGILIGVAAVVAMLALGRGAQKAIETQLSSLGSNLLVLRPGAMRVGGVAQDAGATTRITIEDVGAIQTQIPTVRYLSPSVNGRAQVLFGANNWSTQVQGTGTSYPHIHAATPSYGRFFTDEENQKRARVAVIGMTVARELFGEQSPIGETIKINRVSFQVIGILPEKGSSGWRDQDDVVIVPLLTAMHRLLGKEYVDSVDLEVRDPQSLDAAQDSVIDLMNARKKIPLAMQNDAFQIWNMADVQSALTESGRTMSLLLASIAAISLLVGGIGIMNIMLVSVTERTKEIGLRKAIGARRRDILLQFLAESIAVSTIGGVAGIALGWLITFVLATVTGWNTSIALDSVVVSFFFSAFIGVVFGSYPAKKRLF